MLWNTLGNLTSLASLRCTISSLHLLLPSSSLGSSGTGGSSSPSPSASSFGSSFGVDTSFLLLPLAVGGFESFDFSSSSMTSGSVVRPVNWVVKNLSL